MATDNLFAVVDVETTGLFPERSDRIIEIAVVNLDSNGKVVNEYTTLVNPHRDIGPTHIHGITAGDVRNAPSFEDIAGEVISRLSGTVFVAHNVHFDMRFVKAEMKRLGCLLPQFPFLCTMQLARRVDACICGRRLDQLCNHFHVPLYEAHSALCDARATAKLLTIFITDPATGTSLPLEALGIAQASCGCQGWPSLPRIGKRLGRETAARVQRDAPCYIARLVSRLPATTAATSEADAYLELLDRALEDRRITETESEALFSLAQEIGLSRDQALSVHRKYLTDLVTVALADGVLSEFEKKDLAEVSCLLGLGEDELREQLQQAQGGPTTLIQPGTPMLRNRSDLKGKSVCFTGTMGCRIAGKPVTRELAEKLASDAGMVVKSRVTKSLDYLVTADPDSISGKAAKARQYGIRILAEAVFWRMVGASVDDH